MHNIFMTSCYKIEGETYGNVHYNGYKELTELCVKSFCKNLADIDEVVILNREVNSYHDMNKDIYAKIKKRYFANDCNILYVDSDIVCVKPHRIFGIYNNFRMFDVQKIFQYAYPENVPKYMYACFQRWWMSNVRYYPAGIKQLVWEVGDSLVENWIDVWAFECIIYNSMFYAQKDPNTNFVGNPLLNCQYVPGQTDEAILKDAKIIHVQSTRGIDEAIKRVREVLK